MVSRRHNVYGNVRRGHDSNRSRIHCIVTCDYVKVGSHADMIHRADCVTCNAQSWADHYEVGIIVDGMVPGGHNYDQASEQYKFQAGFDKGLDAYKKARGEGLRPSASTTQAVDKAHKEVKSHQRALKKLGMKRSDLDMPVAAGVE